MRRALMCRSFQSDCGAWTRSGVKDDAWPVLAASVSALAPIFGFAARIIEPWRASLKPLLKACSERLAFCKVADDVRN